MKTTCPSNVFLRLCSFAITALILASCRMTDSEFNQWAHLVQRQNEQYQQEINEAKREIQALKLTMKAREQDKHYLEKRANILENELKELENTWFGLRKDSRAFLALVQACIDDADGTFNDVRMGRPPMEQEHTWRSNDFTVIVDMNNQFETDCVIKTIELYTKEPPSFSANSGFYAAIFQPEPNGSYSIRSISECLFSTQVGLNRIHLGNKILEAKQGDRYGLILNPRTPIDYNQLDTGAFFLETLSAIPNDRYTITVTPSMPPKRTATYMAGRHEFAFSFVGFSNDKRIFLVNSAAQKQKRKLHNVELTYNATSDIIAPKSFFVAVFMPHPEVAGYFVLRQLSSKFTINSNGTTTISLEKDAMTVEPGDHCAILLPTGYRAAQIKTLPKTQTIIEADFNPSKPVFFAQLFRNDDVPQTTTSHIDSVFIDVTFK